MHQMPPSLKCNHELTLNCFSCRSSSEISNQEDDKRRVHFHFVSCPYLSHVRTLIFIAHVRLPKVALCHTYSRRLDRGTVLLSSCALALMVQGTDPLSSLERELFGAL